MRCISRKKPVIGRAQNGLRTGNNKLHRKFLKQLPPNPLELSTCTAGRLFATVLLHSIGYKSAIVRPRSFIRHSTKIILPLDITDKQALRVLYD
jgi:hypothetical protein